MTTADDPARSAIVAVNYRSHRLLDTNFGFADRLAGSVRVIVVDNYSSPEERVAIGSLCESRGWVLLGSDRNVGYGAAVNLGAAEAFRLGCTCVLLVNPDATLTADVADQLLRSCRRDPRTAVSPILVNSAGEVCYRGAEFGLSTGRTRGLSPARVDPEGGPVLGASRLLEPGGLWLTGACMAFHRDLFTRIGGFEESYFLYWEDVDFSYRAACDGATLLVRPDLTAVHDEGGTQARTGRAKSSVYYYYNARNRLRFAARRLPRAAVLSWIATTPRVTWEIWLQGGRRQLVESPQTLLSAGRGAAAGVGFALTALLTRRPALVPARNDPVRVPLVLTVAMLTFHRQDELRSALPLLLEQVADVSDGQVRVDVLIVDNDPAGGAEHVVRPYRGSSVRYVVEPRPGIAAARNRALDETVRSDLLVFIDDDERPCPGWLRNLLTTYRATGAVAVTGPVVSEFAVELDPWVAAGEFFRRRRLRTGTPVHVASTNNLLVDVRSVRALGVRFDSRFGLSGCDDTLFTRTLAERGASMVWCDEAVVADVVPAPRTTRSWVLRRAFSSGNSWSLTSVAIPGTVSGRWKARGLGSLRGAVRLSAGAARYGLGIVLGSPQHRARGLRTLARGAGMMVGSAGLAYQEYARSSTHRGRLKRVAATVPRDR